METGCLYLIPSLIADIPPLEVIPLSVKKVIDSTQHFIVENEKNGRAFIKKVVPGKDQSALIIHLLNKFTTESELDDLLLPCAEGHPVGLISDAGAPSVADPGSSIVSRAYQRNIRVSPLSGPSSRLMAVMASGMNGQDFAFVGYIPIDRAERRNRLRDLERHSRKTGQSQFFMETPYRNDKLFADLLATLPSDVRLCVARNISHSDEFIRTMTVGEWKHQKLDLHKQPTIFGLDARTEWKL